ncbi:hypothetical protein ACHAWF_000786 [Thalassiosira exigua]
MPRMLAPSNSSLRRSGSSLNGSRASLSSYGSRTTAAEMRAKYNGSQFSLRRSSLQNGSISSNGSSRGSNRSMLRRESSHQRSYNLAQEYKETSSYKNAVWDFVDQASVAVGPPSLASSVTSGTTASTASTMSSAASLLSPTPGCSSPQSIDEDTPMQRFYAQHKAFLQRPKNARPAIPPMAAGVGSDASTSNNTYGLHRHTILYATNGNIPRRNSLSILKEEDTWGHFVETTDDDDDLVSRTKSLSVVSRKYPASFAHLGHARVVE